VRERTARQKGTRELAAVVVFCSFSQQIRLNPKEYCQRNQLSHKLFNRKYKVYRQLFPDAPDHAQPVKLEEVKLEEVKLEQPSDQEEARAGEDREDREGEGLREVEGPREAIELIYDCLFTSAEYQLKRQETMDKMARRCGEIDQRVFLQMEWTSSHTLRLYYAIFAFLKQLGLRISFTKYRRAVASRTGHRLLRRYNHATERAMRSLSDKTA
jgi:hypothetical protein